jgi:hypothetical protein
MSAEDLVIEASYISLPTYHLERYLNKNLSMTFPRFLINKTVHKLILFLLITNVCNAQQWKRYEVSSGLPINDVTSLSIL